jgi:DNA polymerase-3 subunit epsilon/CBS domain-containing protein
MSIKSTTPLIALDAVVLDTETTGLDPASARLVEIAAIRLVGGVPDNASSMRRLVKPGIPIPAQSTAFHRIDDAAVAQAPSFRELWPELSAFIGDAVVIGHSIGFDLAVLKRECERAGVPWTRPRSLCVRILGEIANRDLAGYSLEHLANWLDVDVSARHSALGDATTATRVFTALLPRLRERGIRTLAEAEAASRGLDRIIAGQQNAGWVAPVASPHESAAETELGRIDTYPYRHRVADVMRAPPRFIAPDASVGTALAKLMQERISSLFVAAPAGEGAALPRPHEAGIVTERDILRAVSQHGGDALAVPVSYVASRPLAAVSAGAFVYRAIGHMSRLKVRHLGVTDDDGRICGALSARDLLRLRAQDAVVLGDALDDAATSPELAGAWARLPLVARGLVAEGVPGRDVAAVVSRELGALTARASAIAEARMKADGFGDPPCPYSFAVLGSAGRGESLLAMDQDNAMVFAEGEPGGSTDRWFERHATHVADFLHEVGVPYCKGGVMAKNPTWRGSVATWRERIDDWITRASPEDLLSVDIFFDMRGVHGALELANELWRYGYDRAKGEMAFAKLLAESAGPVASSLTWLGGIRTVEGRIDLKKAGLFGIVSLARVLAIRHHVVARSTPERIAGIVALGIGSTDELAALADAQATFLDLILGQQIVDIQAGLPATNTVAVKRLSLRERERLKGALEQVRHLNELGRELLFRS